MRPRTCSPVWRSRITASIPALASSWPSSSPEGPAPTMATCVRRWRDHRSPPPASGAASAGLHPVAPLRLRRGRRRQEGDQRPRGFRLARGRADRRRERGHDLDRRRQRPEDVDPLEVGQLRELLEAELHAAARHEGADGDAGGRCHDPVPDLGRDAPALEQPAERDAAGPGRGADGARGQHRPAKRVLVADLGPPRPGAHGDGDGRMREIDRAAGREVAGREQLLDRVARERHDVERLAGLHAPDDLDAADRFQRDRLAGTRLESAVRAR